MGKAMMGYLNYEKYNFHLCAGFDIDPELVGTEINGVHVYSIEELPEYCRNNKVDICILTVARSAARELAHQLKELNVPAIWNLTNVDLGLEDTDIVVRNLALMDMLFSLTFQLEEAKR